MKSSIEKRSSTKNLPSFQLENHQTRKLIFKLSRSCSNAGLIDLKSSTEKAKTSFNLTSKKTPLNTLLEAVWSQSVRRTSLESSQKISIRLSVKQKVVQENKPFVR